MVTSAIIRALSVQAPADADVETAVSLPPGVPGVSVVDASGVDGEGVSVGRDKPGLVGGRVDVMKTDRVGVGVSSEISMHEASARAMSSITVQILFMERFYRENMKAN
jgi:hypothetical protein